MFGELFWTVIGKNIVCSQTLIAELSFTLLAIDCTVYPLMKNTIQPMTVSSIQVFDTIAPFSDDRLVLLNWFCSHCNLAAVWHLDPLKSVRICIMHIILVSCLYSASVVPLSTTTSLSGQATNSSQWTAGHATAMDTPSLVIMMWQQTTNQMSTIKEAGASVTTACTTPLVLNSTLIIYAGEDKSEENVLFFFVLFSF